MKKIDIYYKGKIIDSIYTLDTTTDETIDELVNYELEYNVEWEEC